MKSGSQFKHGHKAVWWNYFRYQIIKVDLETVKQQNMGVVIGKSYLTVYVETWSMFLIRKIAGWYTDATYFA